MHGRVMDSTERARQPWLADELLPLRPVDLAFGYECPGDAPPAKASLLEMRQRMLPGLSHLLGVGRDGSEPLFPEWVFTPDRVHLCLAYHVPELREIYVMTQLKVLRLTMVFSAVLVALLIVATCAIVHIESSLLPLLLLLPLARAACELVAATVGFRRLRTDPERYAAERVAARKREAWVSAVTARFDRTNVVSLISAMTILLASLAWLPGMELDWRASLVTVPLAGVPLCWVLVAASRGIRVFVHRSMSWITFLLGGTVAYGVGLLIGSPGPAGACGGVAALCGVLLALWRKYPDLSGPGKNTTQIAAALLLLSLATPAHFLQRELHALPGTLAELMPHPLEILAGLATGFALGTIILRRGSALPIAPSFRWRCVNSAVGILIVYVAAITLIHSYV